MNSTANTAYTERTPINRRKPHKICKDIYILTKCLANENTDNLDSVYQTQTPLDEGTEELVQPNLPITDTEPTLQDIVKEILALKKTTESQNLAITTLSHDNEKLSIRADQLMAENDALKQRVAILEQPITPKQGNARRDNKNEEPQPLQLEAIQAQAAALQAATHRRNASQPTPLRPAPSAHFREPNSDLAATPFETKPLSAAPLCAAPKMTDIYIANVATWHNEEALRYHIHKNGEISKECIVLNELTNETAKKAGYKSFKASIPQNKLKKVIEYLDTRGIRAELFRSQKSKGPRRNNANGRNNQQPFRRPTPNPRKPRNPQQSRYIDQRPPYQHERSFYQPGDWNPRQEIDQRYGQYYQPHYYQPQQFDQYNQRYQPYH